jgi:hypothetical protein
MHIKAKQPGDPGYGIFDPADAVAGIDLFDNEDDFLLACSTAVKPVRPVSLPPTKSEQKLWKYYLSLGTEFYRSLERIAKETGLAISTVQRANRRFRELGKLKWTSGHGNRESGAWGTSNMYSITQDS